MECECNELLGRSLIAAFRQEEKVIGPDLVAARLQVLGAVGMFTNSDLGLVALRVSYDCYPIAVFDPIIDLESRTASFRSGLFVYPPQSGDRMVRVRMVSGRLVDTGNSYAHDGEGDQDNRKAPVRPL